MGHIIPETPAEYDATRIIERPDGFYWQSREGGRESGPFATLLEAVKDMEYCDESPMEAEEALGEVEDDIGMANWIDPDTGEPAEDNVPHIDDH